jgi:hypothetical protein
MYGGDSLLRPTQRRLSLPDRRGDRSRLRQVLSGDLHRERVVSRLDEPASVAAARCHLARHHHSEYTRLHELRLRDLDAGMDGAQLSADASALPDYRRYRSGAARWSRLSVTGLPSAV